MKKFLLQYKKIWYFVFTISIIIFSFYFIFASERFQERLAPINYWENKVIVLQGAVKRDNIKLKSLEIDLEKELLSSNWHRKEAFIESEKNNIDLEQTYQDKKDEHYQKITQLKKEIDRCKFLKIKDSKDLEKAVCQLNSCK